MRPRLRLGTVSVLAATMAFAAALRAEEDTLSILAGPSTSLDAPVLSQKSELRKLFGETTSEQNIFFDQFEKGQFEKALYQWYSAFKPSAEKALDVNHQALFSFILYQNGLKLTALESLFKIEKPESVSPVLVQLWKNGVAASDPVWGHLEAKWTPGWTQFFGADAEVAFQSRKLSEKKDLKELEELLQKSAPQSIDRARIAWQIALILAVEDRIPDAARVLRQLIDLKSRTVSLPEVHLNIARLLYQSGYLDAAISYYEKIPRGSNFWLVGQEELAWSYLRKGEPQNSLALTKTLTSPLLTSQSEPEYYFLHALTSLKVCDYPAVLKAIESFKARYRPRAQKLVELAQTGESPAASAFLERLKSGPISISEVASSYPQLPPRLASDSVASELVQSWVMFEKESSQAQELYARSVSGAASQIGFVAAVDGLKSLTASRAQQVRSAGFQRIKALAQDELNEISMILRKMQIVEAEVISQVQLADTVIESTKKLKTVEDKIGTTVKASPISVKYPFEGENWFDEVGSYRVDLKKGCVAKRSPSK